MSNLLTTGAFIAILWLILIVAFRRRSWGIVLWLPPFLGLTFWMLFVVLPLFKPIPHGVDSGWVTMGVMFSLLFNLPLIALWIILLFCWPPKKIANRRTTLIGFAISIPIYVLLHLISTVTIPLRVVDQDGKGIENCSISYTLVSHNVIYIREKHYHGSTDANGLFRFRTFPSQTMDIDSVTRDSYELEPYTQRSYGIPDKSPTNPIIFKMWSTNIHEQLITGEKKFSVIPDGRWYVIDLANRLLKNSK